MTALKPCGTMAAYSRHINRGEQTCEQCRQANSDYQRALRRAKGLMREAKELRPCGTVAAYVRHLRRDEDPCPECCKAKQAESEAVTEARRRLKVARSAEFGVLRAGEQRGSVGWLAAMASLVRNHRVQYLALLVECRAELAREQRQAVTS